MPSHGAQKYCAKKCKRKANKKQMRKRYRRLTPRDKEKLREYNASWYSKLHAARDALKKLGIEV
jgi:FixJ family two-component response regulator